MTRSMTAYASAETVGPTGTLSCELRTVNHRYLELSPRLPDDLRNFESAMRERIAVKLSRGKVDLTVRLRSEARADSLELRRRWIQHLERLAKQRVRSDAEDRAKLRVTVFNYPFSRQHEPDWRKMKRCLVIQFMHLILTWLEFGWQLADSLTAD